MKSIVPLITLLLTLPITPLAAPLDDALNIVMSQSATVQARHSIMGVSGTNSDLKGKISLATGYADKQTQDFAGGFDYRARFQVEYPIFGGTAKITNDQERAKALSDLYIAEESLRSQFLSAVHNIAELERNARALIQDHALKIDRLRYMQELDSQAKPDEKQDLWSYIEAAKNAENAAFQADQKFLITLETVSRTYGKDQWAELQGHILAHIKETGKPISNAPPQPQPAPVEEPAE